MQYCREFRNGERNVESKESKESIVRRLERCGVHVCCATSTACLSMGCGCDLWRGCGRAIDRALGLGTRAHGHGGECGGSLRATRRPPKLRFSRTGGSAGCRTRTSLEWRANRDTESRRESHNHKHRQTGPHAHALFGPRHEASRGKKLLVLRAYMYPVAPPATSNPKLSLKSQVQPHEHT